MPAGPHVCLCLCRLAAGTVKRSQFSAWGAAKPHQLGSQGLSASAALGGKVLLSLRSSDTFQKIL